MDVKQPQQYSFWLQNTQIVLFARFASQNNNGYSLVQERASSIYLNILRFQKDCSHGC